MCFLKSSKLLMHESHYGYIKNKYGNRSNLLHTETDSLIYEIKTEDVYDVFIVIGKMKDETGDAEHNDRQV